MRPIDFAKALGVAALIFVLNVAITIGVVAVYATWIDPGHPGTYYIAVASHIAAWSAPAGGAVLFACAALILGYRDRRRNPILFAVTAFAIYFAFDAGSIFALMDAKDALLALQDPVFGMSMMASFIGALLGALMAPVRRRRVRLRLEPR